MGVTIFFFLSGFLITTLMRGERCNSLIGNRLFYIGLVSYSLYLLHFAVIFGVERALPMTNVFAQACLALALSCGLSSAIYWVVDKPFARLRHNLK